MLLELPGGLLEKPDARRHSPALFAAHLFARQIRDTFMLRCDASGHVKEGFSLGTQRDCRLMGLHTVLQSLD
jgi:hypothetical protein